LKSVNLSVAKLLPYFSGLPAESPAENEDTRSEGERFAIPFSFKPQLSFWEGVIGAAGAFLRVLSGCILFAVWGAYSLMFWNTIRSLWLRIGLLSSLLIAFLLSQALTMLAIAAVMRSVLPRSSRAGRTAPSPNHPAL